MHLRFLLLSIPLLSACQTPKTYTPELSKHEVRAEELEQQKILNDVTEEGGLPKKWKTPKNMKKQFMEVADKIEQAGADVCRELNLQKNGCYYYFRLSRKDEINAEADGENITVFSGMMRFVENDDEIAAVLGHEFAHNLMKHNKAQGNNALVGMLLGATLDAVAASQGISTGSGFGRLGGQMGALSYSADFEKEADYIGLYVTARAGYDISKAPFLWRRLSLLKPENINTSTTHPSNSERFIAMQKIIYEINYKHKHGIPLVPDFKAN